MKQQNIKINSLVVVDLSYPCNWSEEEAKAGKVYRVSHIHNTVNGPQVELENVKSSYPISALIRVVAPEIL